MTNQQIMKTFQRPPTLVTGRLTLRRMLPSDDADMYEYACLPEVTEYLLWSPHPSREHTRRYLEMIQGNYKRGEFFDWAIVLTAGGKMIGTCGFTCLEPDHRRAEVGYVLNPAYWGRGLAPEAVMAAEEFAFRELGMNRVEAHFMQGNDRSLRVMQKCGMTLEGYLQQYMFVKGQYRTIGIAAITRDRFRASGCYRRAEEKKGFRLFGGT